jgi:hypothetical protein
MLDPPLGTPIDSSGNFSAHMLFRGGRVSECTLV